MKFERTQEHVIQNETNVKELTEYYVIIWGKLKNTSHLKQIRKRSFTFFFITCFKMIRKDKTHYFMPQLIQYLLRDYLHPFWKNSLLLMLPHFIAMYLSVLNLHGELDGMVERIRGISGPRPCTECVINIICAIDLHGGEERTTRFPIVTWTLQQ